MNHDDISYEIVNILTFTILGRLFPFSTFVSICFFFLMIFKLLFLHQVLKKYTIICLV